MNYKITAYLICILMMLSACSAPYHKNLSGDSHELAAIRKEKFAEAKAHNITEITTHKEMWPTINKLSKKYGPENVWIVWDIDDCVTYPLHPACLPISYAKKHKDNFKDMTKQLTPTQLSIVWNLKYREPENGLTDDDLPRMLNEVKAMGIPTLGLTASMAGAVKREEDIQHAFRYERLKKLGIQFSFPLGEDEIQFENFPKFHKSHPVYYKGIAFSQSSEFYGSATKGEIIEALGEHLGRFPKVVIMIDDSERNLHFVDHYLKPKGIEVYSFKFKSERVHGGFEISEKDYREYIQNLIDIAIEATAS